MEEQPGLSSPSVRRTVAPRISRSFKHRTALLLIVGLVAFALLPNALLHSVGAQSPTPTRKQKEITGVIKPHAGKGGFGCLWAVVMRFPHVRDAVSYELHYYDSYYKGSQTEVAPPFYTDFEKEIPEGSHEIGLTGATYGNLASGTTDAKCEVDANSVKRFTPEPSFAILAGDDAIQGKVGYKDGTPMTNVTVKVSGKKSESKKTDSKGEYRFSLPKGTYTVTAMAKVCVMPKPGGKCSASGDVSIPGGRVVNFQSPLEGSIKGIVRDAAKKGIQGVTVEAAGTKKFTAVSSASGEYVIRTDPDKTYTVKPLGKSEREKYEPGQQTADTSDDKVTLEDFILDPKLYLEVKFEQSEVSGDGFGRARALITAKDARDQPAAGKEIKIEPSRRGTPKAIVCDPHGGGLLWPSRNADGSLSTESFRKTTSLMGKLRLEIFTGTESGDWILAASDPGDGATTGTYDQKELTITSAGGGSSLLPPELLSLLRSAEDNSVSIQATTDADEGVAQELLVDWFLRLKLNGETRGFMSSLDFAPINSNGPGGKRHGGLIVAPFGSAANGLPSGEQTGVLDARGDVFAALATGGRQLPNSLPTRPEWENGTTIRSQEAGGSYTVIPHGAASFGRVVPSANESFTFLGWPYPPPSVHPNHHAFSTCLGSTSALGSNEVHSPINLLFTDPTGKRLGYDSQGKRHNELTGSVSVKGDSKSYVLAPGPYRVDVTGTGKGRATIVTHSPGLGPPAVYSFTATKGAKGQMNLAVPNAGPAQPPALMFGGKPIASNAGIGMKIQGLPKSLEPGKKMLLKGKVVDELGKPVPGVAISSQAPPIEEMTDDKGSFAVTVTAPAGGPMALAAKAPGYKDASLNVAPPPPAAPSPPPIAQQPSPPTGVKASRGAAQIALLLLMIVAAAVFVYFRQRPAALQTTSGNLREAGNWAANRVREVLKRPPSKPDGEG